MTSVGVRAAVLLATTGGLVAALCAAVATVTPADPVLLGEVGGAVLTGVWLVLSLRALLLGRQLAAALDASSRPAKVAGVRCRIIQGGGRRALVLGTLRPTIYIGEELLLALEADELTAVMLHEDYHRRTLAPLRAAALESWACLARPSGRLRDAVRDRLADLERDADAEALSLGATRSSIARALLKSESASLPGATLFGASPDRRLRALVDPSPIGSRLPYEWLPLAVLLVLAGACHAIGPLGA